MLFHGIKLMKNVVFIFIVITVYGMRDIEYSFKNRRINNAR